MPTLTDVHDGKRRLLRGPGRTKDKSLSSYTKSKIDKASSNYMKKCRNHPNEREILKLLEGDEQTNPHDIANFTGEPLMIRERAEGKPI